MKKKNGGPPDQNSGAQNGAEPRESGGEPEEQKKPEKPKKQKKRGGGIVTTVILAVALLAGVGLLVYPTLADWYNSFHQTKAVVEYTEAVAGYDEEKYAELLEAAYAYNEALYEAHHGIGLTDEEYEVYEEQLTLANTSVIGYIEIPKIDVYLPIYHGTSDAALSAGIGHLEGTSLPVGGESTHTVLSGHRGLVSARMFTDLDELEIGDTFSIYVLNEVLTYEVDQILIVLPEDTAALAITEGMDYCTLLTCTPYGINTHRLLVRGHRIETTETVNVSVSAEAFQIEPLMVAPLVAAPVLVILFIMVLVSGGRKRRREAAQSEESEEPPAGDGGGEDKNRPPGDTG